MDRFNVTSFVIVLLFVSTIGFHAQESDGLIEWPYVGADQDHTKYSPVDEITHDNVDELEIVWEWHPNEMPGRSSWFFSGNSSDD